jgi:hypothetical protein
MSKGQCLGQSTHFKTNSQLYSECNFKNAFWIKVPGHYQAKQLRRDAIKRIDVRHRQPGVSLKLLADPGKVLSYLAKVEERGHLESQGFGLGGQGPEQDHVRLEDGKGLLEVAAGEGGGEGVRFIEIREAPPPADVFMIQQPGVLAAPAAKVGFWVVPGFGPGR